MMKDNLDETIQNLEVLSCQIAQALSEAWDSLSYIALKNASLKNEILKFKVIMKEMDKGES